MNNDDESALSQYNYNVFFNFRSDSVIFFLFRFFPLSFHSHV